jgi:multiple sugar transport system substrate-binding protein
MGTEGELLPDFLSSFEEDFPDVTVEVTAIPWDSAMQKFQTAIASGTVPDVAMVPGLPVFEDAYAPVPDEIDLTGMFEGSVSTGTMGGKQLQVPWYVDTRVLYYRTDLAEQAGWTEPPRNWSELHRFAGDLQSKTDARWGLRLPAGGSGSFLNTLWMPWSAGAELMDTDQTTWTLDSPEFAAGYEYLESYFADGIADPNVDQAPDAAVNDFITGSTPALIGGPFLASLVDENAGDAAPYATAVLPTEESSTSFVGGANLTVFTEADNPDAAWRLVQWLSEPETQVEWYKASGDLPAVEAAWDDPVLADSATLAPFREQLRTAKTPPQVVAFDKVGAEGDAAIEQIIRAGVPVEKALADLQRRAESIGVD